MEKKGGKDKMLRFPPPYSYYPLSPTKSHIIRIPRFAAFHSQNTHLLWLFIHFKGAPCAKTGHL